MAPGNGPGGHSPPGTTTTPQAQAAVAESIAKALGSTPSSARPHQRHPPARRRRAFLVRSGLRGHPAAPAAFGIKASAVNPDADILTMRPGLSGISECNSCTAATGQRSWAAATATAAPSYPCPPGQCVANPVIQEVSALPSGTSAPNTVITEHAIHTLGLQTSIQGWLIQVPTREQPPTAAQITQARLTAAAAGHDHRDQRTARPRRRRSSTGPRCSALPWRWASWP